MKLVGLTGGIGSGKSYVAKVFEALGVSVYYADQDAKLAYAEDSELKIQLQNVFGESIYQQNIFQPKILASIVFSDSEKLRQLNLMVHPIVSKRFERWISKQEGPYVLKEAAILFESGAHQHMDKVIGVAADEATRIERVMQRDGLSITEVKMRMSKQWSQEKVLSHCDYIIKNGKDDMLLSQVIKIHEDLIC